jgi:CRISPR-associated protein Csh1
LQQIDNELQENREIIIESIQKMITETPKKEGSLFLTIRFDDGVEKKDLGNYPLFQKILQWESSMDTDKALAENQVCSMCGIRTTVSGNDNTYSFYTTDKEGFISEGFRKEDAWKNYPICCECAKSLEKGKIYIGNHLSYRFTSLFFYLIPKILTGNTDARFLDDL